MQIVHYDLGTSSLYWRNAYIDTIYSSAHIITGWPQSGSGSLQKRTYSFTTADPGGQFLLGQIEDSDTDGACDGVITFAYDYGSTNDQCKLHFNFVQRSGAARGTWWYEGDDQDIAGDRVHVQLIDDGSGGMFVWVIAEDYSKCIVETSWMDGNSVVDSGVLSDGTPTTGTVLFDTANTPTAEMHIGNLFAGDVFAAENVGHTGDTDTKMQFGTNSLLLKAGGATHLDCSSDQTTHLYGGNALALSINTSQNATFAGDVAISSTMPKLTFTDLQQDDWRIMNDNGDFRFTNIDGSGHALVFATNNNATFAGNVHIPDNQYATYGGTNSAWELEIGVVGDNAYITKSSTTSGHLYIRNNGTDKNIYLQTDNGSGAPTTYIKCDGLQGFTEFPIAARFMDNVKLQFGDANDSDIYHNGTDMIIRNHAAAGDMNFAADSTGSGGNATSYFWLDGGQVKTRVAKGMNFEDNVKATFGLVTNPDLEIYHDTSNSYISDIGTGDLIIKGAVVIQNATGDQGAEMHHNALHLQFEGDDRVSPVDAGVEITGNVFLNGSTTPGNIVLDTTLAANQTSGTIIKIDDQTVAPGEVYIRGEASGSGLWARTTAGSESLSGTGLLAYALGTNAQDDGMLLNGVIYDASHSFTIGLPIYIGVTTGTLTTTAPSGSGEVVRIVGYALDANHIYFCPDTTWVLLD